MDDAWGNAQPLHYCDGCQRIATLRIHQKDPAWGTELIVTSCEECLRDYVSATLSDFADHLAHNGHRDFDYFDPDCSLCDA